MQGVRIGHYTNKKQGTGASVFLFEGEAVGAYHLCGSAPASHELPALDLDGNVATVDGLVLTGGSAFGLGAVNGAMRWLREQSKGHNTSHGKVPIVPAAAIYDLGVRENTAPSEENVYQACVSATFHNQDTGNIGVGTGASVGKLIGSAKRMSGGLGRAEMTLVNGLHVLAYAAVNCVGDVRDEKGHIVAGACDDNGQFVDSEAFLLAGHAEKSFAPANTTLVAIFTNAKLSKIELKRVSKMAAAGMARVISPVFTRYDGDLIFAFSLGEVVASELMLGAIATEVTRLAILNAVKNSIVL